MSSRHEKKILEALAISQRGGLSKIKISEISNLSVRELEGVLDNLINNNYINKKHEDQNYYLKPESIIKYPPLKKIKKISDSISKANNPLSTRELATTVNQKSYEVSNVCRRHEKWGWLQKGNPKKKKLYFSPIIRDIMHSGNYELINELRKKLKSVISKYDIEEPKLLNDLKIAFQNILKRDDLKKYLKSINEFRKKLFDAINQKKSKKDVVGLLDIRPFPKDIHTWNSYRETFY